MESAESLGALGRQVRFLREADQLKGVLRQSSILDGTRKENSAEHSWHLALMAQVLDKVALISDGSAALGDFARELVATAVREGFLSPGQ